MKYIVTLIIALFIYFNSQAQAPKVWTSGEIYNAIEKLNFLGSVLYVAAHPDDENTRLISYFSNHVKARTAYLSLTRGDGGQNLIGPEIRELLGVIRTEELLAARRIDGGEQLFSRANDFGYSKHSDETLEIWDKDKVLGDVVWAIRTFKPDIIINRFDHSTPGSTHGHHTASAILSHQAFDLTNDPSKYSDQLSMTNLYQARRLFLNTSWWFYGSREKFNKVDKSDMVSIDVGTYYPIIGKSNLEIAAESRSQHKCQGMGNTGSRGSSLEYIKLLKGDLPPNSNDPFVGINTTWSRIPGGEAIQPMVESLLNEYDFTNPSSIVPSILNVKSEVEKLPDHPWKIIKLNEINSILKAVLGLYLETVTREHRSVAGEVVPLSIEVTNQSTLPITLQKISIPMAAYDSTFNVKIDPNKNISYTTDAHLDKKLTPTAPYWLLNKGTLGMYEVADRQLIGKPETPRSLKAIYHLKVLGHSLIYDQTILYKYNSPEDGPVYRPFEITPPAFVSFPDKVNIFQKNHPKEIKVTITAGKDNIVGKVHLELPDQWEIANNDVPLELKQKGESKTIVITVTPPNDPLESIAKVSLKIDGDEYTHELAEIEYSHIPFQSVLMPAEAKFVYLDLNIVGKKIGYIEGAGDDIPSSLKQVGYGVTMMHPEEITKDRLSTFDAVIVGIRAYNKWPEMKFAQKTLMEYVKNGGTLVLQFNTNRRMVTQDVGPYPLEISRARVSKEDAPVQILKPNHPVMQYPNKISASDFDNWVQERGLYFPGEWDENYTAILSSNDPGEDARNGGLLVAPFGEGWYVYTGYSWFRQLPAGVPGAFRIFANLIALGNAPRP